MENLQNQTYAVTLYFDSDTTSKIKGLVSEFSHVTGSDFLIKNNVPPHVTLGAFHCTQSEVPHLKKLFHDFYERSFDFVNSVKDSKCFFKMDFSSIDTFLDKVIFLKPVMDENLRSLNRCLHDIMLPHFESGDNRNYIPERWCAHVALAVKLSHEQFEKGMSFLKECGVLNGAVPEVMSGGSVILPHSADVVSMGLALCHPFTELERICYE